ncbi:hypothetical protein Bca52824_000882 [Brassica carinata]|uniref:Reverse transcriptase zinc-binding domain-containing protein n=1 Tax=Brassica carinata TaxID=52824 RepID=A0A8X7WI05_BRACI|nr:hypothetical protein Bca52824_000882 [Brassica carinata]
MSQLATPALSVREVCYLVETFCWKTHPWCSTGKKLQPTGPPELATKDLKVVDLLVAGSSKWDKERVLCILPNEAPDILCIRPSKTGAEDAYCWIPTKNGDYTTKSGYYIAMNQMKEPEAVTTNAPRCDWMTDIWQLPISPKISVFLWKVVRGALLLGDHLETRGLIATTKCPFCDMRETADHLFLACQFSTSVWAIAPIQNADMLSKTPELTIALKASKTLKNLPPTEFISGSMFPWIVWMIWQRRNQRIFENRIFDAGDTITKAISDTRKWQSAQLESKPLTMDHSGLARIFTDPTDQILHQGNAIEEWVSSPLVAEALAIREALFQAQAHGYTNIELKSDAQTIIRDIHNLSCYLSSSIFLHFPHLDNIAADSLAKRALLHV